MFLAISLSVLPQYYPATLRNLLRPTVSINPTLQFLAILFAEGYWHCVS
jgi:hypothetical protein